MTFFIPSENVSGDILEISFICLLSSVNSVREIFKAK